MTAPYTLSKRLKLMCKVLMWLSLVLSLAYIGIGYANDVQGILIEACYQHIDLQHRELIQTSALKTFAINTLAFITVSSNLLIYIAMMNVFYRMSTGHVFSLPAVKSIRVLGFMILFYALISVSSFPLMVAVWTYDNPEGHQLFSGSLSTFQGMMLLMGGLFLMIGHIYTEASRIAEENRQYV